MLGFVLDAARRYRRIWLLRRLPYPAMVPPPLPEVQETVAQSFDYQDALDLNEARIKNLDYMQLPLADKSVVDVGAGVGHLAQALVQRGCMVTCAEGRQENVDEIRRRLPGVRAAVFDVERGDLSQLGKFDVVFCYGLIYHVENPLFALRNLASAASNLLLIESMVCDSYHPVMHIEEEPLTPNQALRGFGCRPSPSFLTFALKRLGFHVYGPKVLPDHPCYHFQWRDSLRTREQGRGLRAVVVAAREPLHLPTLVRLDA
ncbi:MAG TPA: methyltransferase domain-containing protein [Gemmatales bacterium]|nr:methyltransferase domain-containing protein [Gemmatales bacterium]